MFFILVVVYLAFQLIGLAIIFDLAESAPAESMNINEDEKAIASHMDDADSTAASKRTASEQVENGGAVASRRPNSLDVDPNDASDGINLRQAVRHLTYYKLWFIFLVCTQGPNFLGGFYKTFGETFISNDHFLATVGSLSSIFNSIGRILWGFVIDKLAFKTTIFLVDTIIVAFISSYYLISYTNSPALFLIWTSVVNLASAGVYVSVSVCACVCFARLLEDLKLWRSCVNCAKTSHLMTYVSTSYVIFLASLFDVREHLVPESRERVLNNQLKKGTR